MSEQQSKSTARQLLPKVSVATISYDYNLIIYSRTRLLKLNLREIRETCSGVSFAENPLAAVL